MSSKVWDSVRVPLLAVVMGSALIVLGKAIVFPKSQAVGTAYSSTYTLPTSVPLKDWQLLTTTPVKEDKNSKEETNPKKETNPAPDQKYQYRQGNTVLEARVRLELGDGNVSRFMFVNTPLRAANANLKIKYQPETGFYGVLTHQGRAYLSACITPRGESTVTESQFTQSRYKYDLQVGRVLPWVLGEEPLLDRRCLWTLMSVPLRSETTNDSVTLGASEEAVKTLEALWPSWFQWWQSNFPPLKS